MPVLQLGPHVLNCGCKSSEKQSIEMLPILDKTTHAHKRDQHKRMIGICRAPGNFGVFERSHSHWMAVAALAVSNCMLYKAFYN
jgi:hypothetical protein